MRRRRLSSPLEPPGSQTVGGGILTPYWGSWCGPNNPGNISGAVDDIPVSTSQSYNNEVDSPRKTTVDASTLFGVRERTPVAGYPTNTRAAGSGEISGRILSLSRPKQLLHYLLVGDRALDGPPSRGGTHGPDTHPGNDVVPEPQSEGRRSPESAPAGPIRSESRLVNFTGPMSSVVRKVRD